MIVDSYLKKFVVFSILLMLMVTIVPLSSIGVPVSGDVLQLLAQKPHEEYEGVLPISYNRTLYVGGTGAGNYTTIQEAIDDASHDSTIFVWDDTAPYYEHLMISKKIKLLGENKESTIIDGGGSGTVVSVTADGVIISGFTLQNSGSNEFDAGIKLDSDNNVISGNIITDNNRYGIYSYDLDNSVISGNTFTNNVESALHLPFTSNNLVSQNTITNNMKYGIYLYDSTFNTVSENRIADNEYGIHLWYNFNTSIQGNTVTGNEVGIELCHRSARNIIFNNTITDNNLYGLNLSYSPDNKIYENTVSNNVYGIYFSYSFDNDIYNDNVISYNEYGIYLGYSSGNRIYDRNLVTHNQFGIYLSSSSNNEIVEGNDIGNNEHGVYFNFSSENTMEGNIVTYNRQIGVYVCYNSNANLIASNNFIVNHPHAYFKQSFVNYWEENYWDNWRGFGPYWIKGEIRIFGIPIIARWWFNIDFHPVKDPYDL